MNLLIVQYGGDYREAFRRLAEGGDETYHAQKYVINSVTEIGAQMGEVTFLCCKTAEFYNERLQDGFRAIGAGLNPDQETQKLINLIAAQKPTHLVIHAPIREVFRWAVRKQIKTIGLLADSFLKQGLRRNIRNYRLSRLLNNPQIDWVANHGLNACRSLQQIGVNPEKIIPWDWPHTITPASLSAKTLRREGDPWTLMYVGLVGESKGVGDILTALAHLKRNGLPFTLKIAGKGKIDYFSQRVHQFNLEDSVEFLGLTPHHKIVPLMREADVVLIPSRHNYPEGLPLTIYEAFSSRTPIVASDHPMFQGNLLHEVNAMVFPAGDSAALAACIQKLLSDPALYHQLSHASYEAWEKLQISVKWAELISRWVNDAPMDREWLFEHRLASGRYH